MSAAPIRLGESRWNVSAQTLAPQQEIMAMLFDPIIAGLSAGMLIAKAGWRSSRTVVQLRQQGTTILLVEQMVERALQIADSAYVLQNGLAIDHGPTSQMRGSEMIRQAYSRIGT